MSAESSTTRGRSDTSGLLVVALLAVAFAIVPRLTRSCDTSGVDRDAPNFKARVVANGAAIPSAAGADAGVDGPASTLELTSLRGHPVVLDFWATWCGPCQAEAPIMNALAQRYKERGLVVVGVNTSDEDGLAARFARKKQLGFPIVYDEENAIARDYNVSRLPTVLVVSKSGKIVAALHGLTSDSALDEIVRRQL